MLSIGKEKFQGVKSSSMELEHTSNRKSDQPHTEASKITDTSLKSDLIPKASPKVVKTPIKQRGIDVKGKNIAESQNASLRKSVPQKENIRGTPRTESKMLKPVEMEIEDDDEDIMVKGNESIKNLNKFFH